MAESVTPNQNVIDELEQSKNEVLQRIAEKLKNQMDSDCCVVSARHSSHSSGASGRTHTSVTLH